MENKKIPEISDADKTKLNKISHSYGLIVILVNFLGFELANSVTVPGRSTENHDKWIEFMSERSLLIGILCVIAFVMPTILIFRYRSSMVNRSPERIINVPFVFSAYGCLGWIFSFFVQIVFILIAKIRYGIEIADIFIGSFINILQISICIFTLAFLILDFIHRKFVLPDLYPNGNLSKFRIEMKPTVRFIVIVFYISICIFPVFFTVSALSTVIRNNNIRTDRSVFIVFGIIMMVSLIILWAFCDFFTAPLAKLKLGIQKIKAGDYSHRVDIVSSDDFGELADAFNEMSSSLDEKSRKIIAIQNSIIRGMAVMVESRDNSTGGHISRTSDCVKIFIEKLVQTEKGAELSPEFCKAVIKAAPMHDLGKIAVDDAILRKPGKFTDEEYEIMKTHSAEGARIVENVLAQADDEAFRNIAVNVAHYHHEKWNGTGYPEKLSAESIPLEARIMALADVFDALVSKRCYKDSFTYDKAFSIIEESLGSHFDPELGKIFIECRPELEALYTSYSLHE